jgi:glycosyltransferase involved in cell wall biosynthesis
MTSSRRRVIWAYDREHLLHPFIVMGLNTLAEAGWDVTVVSADKALGAAYRSFDAFSFERRVRNFQHLVFKVRGELEQRAIKTEHARQKIQKKLDREGDRIPRRKRRSMRWDALKLEVAKRAIMAWRAVLKDFGAWRRLSYDTWLIYVRGFLRLLKLDGDVMIASRPEAAVWACIAAKARGMRFVYFPFELYGEQIVKPTPAVAWLERFILRHCVDAVITQNDCRAAVLKDERGSRRDPLIVHNYKSVRPEHRAGGKLRAAHGIGPDKRIVLYEGVIVDGRWLEFVAQSVLHLPDDVVLVMMGQEKLKWRMVFAEQIKAALATGRLIVAPPVPHDDLPDYVADADVGVIIYDDSVRNNVFCEPGKLTDYIAVGVPVVAPNFPTIGPVVRGYDIGLCFDGHSPEAIAETLRQVLQRPKSEWAPALERACSELTWETQAPNLLAAVTGGHPSESRTGPPVAGGRIEELGGVSAATNPR